MIDNTMGAMPSSFDIRDYTLITRNNVEEIIPSTFCLKPILIKNQHTKPTCVAHALSSLIEYHNFLETHEIEEFSTEFIYGCRKDGDYQGNGMYLRDGLKIIQKYGDVLKQSLPYNNNVKDAVANVTNNADKLFQEAYPNRISTYYKITDVDKLKYSIFHDGPAVAGIKVYNTIKLNKNNIYEYNITKKKNFFGHAIMIIGWTKDNWIVQNSWGKSWGNKGIFYIPIEKSFDEIFFEVYGVTDNITNVKQSNKIVQKTYPLINFIINFFRR